MKKWVIELGEHAIIFKPKASVRVQILADFIVKIPGEDPLAVEIPIEEEISEPWSLDTDESSCQKGFRAGIILTIPKGMKFTYALRIVQVVIWVKIADNKEIHEESYNMH
uniref:Reverse transcriptase domain-containing protein n=1 Tax=Tanacetum cinerariifolium TaxID=118510 RepID=A0A6L2N7H0_TANCI|nr:reverse transcriptase domain-containing protein [Tanacetum cinerariifolium]